MQSNPKRKREAGIRGVESLETRSLLSGTPLANPGDVDAADTLDQATQLGVLTPTQIEGSISQGSDVDWYAFTLQFASTVTMDGSGATFGLYDSGENPLNDPWGSFGHRLLGQVAADGSDSATLTRDLAAGTYYVAVSGLGNNLFHPLIASSGLPGQTGEYVLDLSSTQIDTSASTDPVVLSIDAAALGLRIDLSDALDFAPTVTLFDDDGSPVAVASISQNESTGELLIVPDRPLSAGHYRVVVKDQSDNTRLTVEFDVPAGLGAESGPEGNDTAATAEELGELTDAGLVQVTGVIGDDPYYSLTNLDPSLFAGNDVDLYHFHINATQTVGLQAEVFAGRIGSSLDAGLTLYRLNPTTGSLEYVTGNNNSLNPFRVGEQQPLYFDPLVIAGLNAGDYYLAVSHGKNAITALEGAGSAGSLLDPTTAHGGVNGTNVGAYVLNLQVVPLGTEPPRVVSVSIEDDAELPTAPTVFTVKFSEFVDLTSAAYAALRTSSDGTIPGVFVTDGKGNTYYPSLQSFNPATLEARFVMTRRLPAGGYELHLSGSKGLVDLSGAPLVGNDSSGDFVLDFKVHKNSVGTNGNPRLWTYDADSDDASGPQNLGTLFPTELLSGVEINRPETKGKQRKLDTHDEYQFEVLWHGTYVFHLSGLLANGLRLSLTDSDGNTLDVASQDDGHILIARLSPGTYTVHVSNNGGILIPILGYRVAIVQVGIPDNAPPLSVGPTPTVGMKLSGLSDPVPGGDKPGSGPTSPGGGISRPGQIGGGSSAGNSSTSSNVSSYLPLRTGLDRLNLADASGNIVIAIPTVTQSGTISAPILRAARSGRTSLSSSESLTARGLSDLADGPIGRSRSLGGLLNNSAAGGRSLQALINSSLSADRNVAEEAPRDQQNQASNDPRSDENVEPAKGDAITSSESHGESDAGNSASRKPASHDPGFLLNAISMLYDGPATVSTATVSVDQTTTADEWDTDSVLIVSAEEYSTFETSSDAIEVKEQGDASHLTDKLFAVGLGLLMSDLFLPRTTDSKSRHPVSVRPRHAARRGAQHSARGEDSGA